MGHLNPHQISLRSVQWFRPHNGVKYNNFVHFFLCLCIYLSIYLSIHLSIYLSIYLSMYLCMYRFTFTPPQSEPLDRFGRLIGQIVQTDARNDPFGIKIILLALLEVICPPIWPNLARYRDFVWENR